MQTMCSLGCKVDIISAVSVPLSVSVWLKSCSLGCNVELFMLGVPACLYVIQSVVVAVNLTPLMTPSAHLSVEQSVGFKDG